MRNKRLYALYEKRDGKWIRLSQFAWVKESAVRIFQSQLLAPCIGGTNEVVRGIRSLRVTKVANDVECEPLQRLLRQMWEGTR